MTTPSYSSGEANPYFNFEENNFADMPLPRTEENQSASWGDQLNSSALELQSPMPRHPPINETSGSTPSEPHADSLWDERTPLIGMPTNGKVALAAIMLGQNTPEEFNLYGTDQVASAAPPEITDQLLFQRLRGRAGTATMMYIEMMRNPVFRARCGVFRADFERTIGRPLRKLTLDFWRIFIMKSNLSTELATALTVIAITEGTTSQSHTSHTSNFARLAPILFGLCCT